MNIDQTNIINEVRRVQVQLDALKRKQDLLLGNLITSAMSTVTQSEITEIMEIIKVIPTGFFKSELKMLITNNKIQTKLQMIA